MDPHHPMNETEKVKEALRQHMLSQPSPVARLLGISDDQLIAALTTENDTMTGGH